MANFADLIPGADTRGLERGVATLDDVVKAGGRAEGATKGVEGGFVEPGTVPQSKCPKHGFHG